MNHSGSFPKGVIPHKGRFIDRLRNRRLANLTSVAPRCRPTHRNPCAVHPRGHNFKRPVLSALSIPLKKLLCKLITSKLIASGLVCVWCIRVPHDQAVRISSKSPLLPHCLRCENMNRAWRLELLNLALCEIQHQGLLGSQL